MENSETQSFGQLAKSVLAKADSTGRFMLGIAGYPAAGKSTTAALLSEAINEMAGEQAAVVVPMDGFHHYNAALQKLDLLDLKGVPASFDAAAFVALLRKIKEQGTTGGTVTCPSFDRAVEEPAPDTIAVEKYHRIVIVEGNYLLLDSEPWSEISAILNEIWFIDCPLAQIEPRLLARHIKGGRSEAAARAKMESTDLPNARLVEASRKRADRIITPTPLQSSQAPG